MSSRKVVALLLIAFTAFAADKKTKQKKPPPPSALDLYIKDAQKHAVEAPQGSVGSLYVPGATFESLGTDLRAARVDDLVTVLVSEQASAVATGNSTTSRATTAASAISALGGITNAKGPLANLLNTSTQWGITGSGTTSRGATLTATLSARVTHVLPNGYLVIEGDRRMLVNSENQDIVVRGVVRPSDILTGNTINSSQIAQMEIQVNGKGIVNDAIKRPFILYRLLLGLLPF